MLFAVGGAFAVHVIINCCCCCSCFSCGCRLLLLSCPLLSLFSLLPLLLLWVDVCMYVGSPSCWDVGGFLLALSFSPSTYLNKLDVGTNVRPLRLSLELSLSLSLACLCVRATLPLCQTATVRVTLAPS